MADRSAINDLTVPTAVVDQLLSRIQDLSKAISLPVETEVRRIFRGDNVQTTTTIAGNNASQNMQESKQMEPRGVSTTSCSRSLATTSTHSLGRVPPTQISGPQRNFVARRRFEGQRSTFTARRQKKDVSKPKVSDNRPFMRDLVLLSGPNDVVVPRQGARLELMEHGHVISGCRFTKGMNAAQVEITIHEAFEDKIPDGVDIELVMSMHTSLVIPSLAPGQHGIDGAILQRLYQNKPVYIRPSRQLIKAQEEASQQSVGDKMEESDLHLNEDIFDDFEDISTPLASPSTPMAPTSTPMEPPSIPIVPPSTLTVPPSTPMAPLSTPMVPHSIPMEPPSTPIVPPSTPMVPPSTPMAPPTSTVAPATSMETPLIVLADGTPDGMQESNDVQVIDEDDDDLLHVTLYPLEPVIHGSREIFLPRSNLLQEMITQFSDTTILQRNLTFVIVGDNNHPESGRGDGVTREVLSLFWKDFFISLAIGAAEKVPCIRHDYQREKWLSVARIIVFGYRSHKYFPITLSKAFVASCLYGEETLPKKCLLDSFCMYVSKDEQEVIKRCFEDKLDVNDEDVLDLLSSYKCYRLPTQESLGGILEEVAHQELVQKPKYIAMAWSAQLQALKGFEEFSNFDKMCMMYEGKRPTPKRIVKLLKAKPSSDGEQACFDHLKRYIKSLDDSKLAGLLQFITGSNVITVEQIDVAFTSHVGVLRCIVARTCGPLLELPSTFQTYNELSEEFTKTLANSFAWSFHVV